MHTRSGCLGAFLLLFCVLAACAQQDAPPEAGDAAAAVADDDAERDVPQRAPAIQEMLAACPHPAPDQDAEIGKFRTGQFAAVDAALQERLEQHLAAPSCEPYLAWLALWIEQARTPELIERWIGERPESWAALTLRARQALGDSGTDLTRVEADLQRAIEIEPRSLVPYYYYVELLEKAGRSAEIRPLLTRLLTRDPFDYVVRERAMFALWPNAHRGADEVAQIAETATPQARSHPRLLLLKGFAASARAGLATTDEERIASYVEALRYGDHVDWYAVLCDALYDRGDVQAVVQVADRWLAWAPDHPHALMWRGLAGLRIDRERGERDIDRAVELDANCAWVLAMRGFSNQVSDPEAALADLLRARELNPNELAAIPPLARIHFHANRLAEAEPLMRQWIAARPDDREAWYYLGAVLVMQGNGEGRPLLERYVQELGGVSQGWVGESVAFARQLLTQAPTVAPRSDVLPGLERLGVRSES